MSGLETLMGQPMGLVVAACAYALGSIPFGLLLAKRVRGIDIRTLGSGNIGATNVARTAGRTLGIATLILDVSKGALPVLIAEHVLHLPLWAVAAAGFFAVFGHCFPVFLKFRGGKGVATALGVFAAFSPVPTLVAVLGFVSVFVVTRIVSVGSLVGVSVLFIAGYFLDPRREFIIVAAAVGALIFIRHAGNLRRLARREEPKTVTADSEAPPR